MTPTTMVFLLLSVLLVGQTSGTSMEAFENVPYMPAACTQVRQCFAALVSGTTLDGTNCIFPVCPDGFQYAARYDDAGDQVRTCVRAKPYSETNTFAPDLTEREPFTTIAECVAEGGPSVANYCIGRFMEANRICMDITARILFDT